MLAAILTVGQFMAEIAQQEGVPWRPSPHVDWSKMLTQGDAVALAHSFGLEFTTSTPEKPLGRLGADWVEQEIHRQRHPEAWNKPEHGKKPKVHSKSDPE